MGVREDWGPELFPDAPTNPAPGARERFSTLLLFWCCWEGWFGGKRKEGVLLDWEA